MGEKDSKDAFIRDAFTVLVIKRRIKFKSTKDGWSFFLQIDNPFYMHLFVKTCFSFISLHKVILLKLYPKHKTTDEQCEKRQLSMNLLFRRQQKPRTLVFLHVAKSVNSWDTCRGERIHCCDCLPTYWGFHRQTTTSPHENLPGSIASFFHLFLRLNSLWKFSPSHAAFALEMCGERDLWGMSWRKKKNCLQLMQLIPQLSFFKIPSRAALISIGDKKIFQPLPIWPHFRVN